MVVAYLLDPKGETVGKELTAALTELEKRIKGQKFFSGKVHKRERFEMFELFFKFCGMCPSEQAGD